jgi:selenocysteine lyase/cysteine desulfurase
MNIQNVRQEFPALTNFLQQQKVLLSVRYTLHVGGVRVSCHLFNNTSDLDRLVELADRFVRRHVQTQGKA